MRQRKKRWAQPYLETSNYVLKTDGSQKVTLNYAQNQPIHLEIGTGKGDFLVSLATKNPSINYLGIELQPSVLAIAVKKAEEKGLTNIRFMLLNAEKIGEVLSEKSIAQLYLNFSDPWPKVRHAKRRLTAPAFLDKYAMLLESRSLLIMKTDNQNLYLFTLEMLIPSKFELLDKQENYILIDNDAETEYEKRFRMQGLPIYRLVMRKKD